MKCKLLEMEKEGYLLNLWVVGDSKIQLTQNYIKHPEELFNKRIKVRILEVDRDKNRLVVSQKAAELGITIKIIKSFDEIKENEPVLCKVIGFSDFGIFCG